MLLQPSAWVPPLLPKPPGIFLHAVCGLVDRFPIGSTNLTNMTEPLQVFASALTTVELALKLYRSLSTFAGKVQHAPKAAKGLIAKAQRLRGTLYMVHLTLQVWICQLRDRKPTVAEQCIWRNIETSLAYWKRTLRRFKREMNELSIVAEGQRMSWVEKTWWQLKHERKDPILQSLQGSMVDCIAQLSLSLQCLNL